MKKLLTFLFFLGTYTWTASAQPGQCSMHQKGFGKNKSHQNQKAEMANRLNLTQEQQEKIRAIHEDGRRQMQALRENKQQSLQQYDEARARIKKDNKSKIQAILTKEQQASMAKMRSEKEENRKAHQLKKLDGLKAKLSLTDNQYEQLKGLQDKNHTAIKKIHDNDNIGPDAKRSAIQKIRESAIEERKKILTAEQWKKMEDMKGGNPNRRNGVK